MEVRKEVRYAGWASVIAIGAVVATWASPAEWRDLLQSRLAKLVDDIASRRVELLFFLGATLLCVRAVRAQRWVAALTALAAGLAWVAFHRPVSTWLNAVGTDSFDEARHFGTEEAGFWLQTAGEILRPRPDWKLYVLCALAATALLLSLHWAVRRAAIGVPTARRLQAAVALALIGVALQQTFASSLALFFENRETYATVRRNFDGPVPSIAARRKLDVVVYIGESTTSMHMGLYGYPRDTTPRLSARRGEDAGLIVFDHVLSTHTHTSASLLEALSIPAAPGQDRLPITERRRVSIVDVLEGAGISTTLYSNQGQSGTWNLASSIVFAQADRQFSTDSRLAGNRDHVLARPFDHVFFDAKVRDTLQAQPARRHAVFLHSYAGHGPYLRHVPDSFHPRVDDAHDRLDARAVVGRDTGLLEALEQYDATVRYVDDVVDRQIAQVAALPRPVVFVYLSDHGESVTSGRAHESSRFTHEMVRIPFIVYFNPAARRAHAGLFARYRRLAAAGQSATLAQLPATLLDLFGARIDDPGLALPPPVGVPASHAPIVVRRTPDGVSAIDIVPATSPDGVADRADDATHAYLAARRLGSSTVTCWRGPHTVAKALRGSIAAGCLEAQLAADQAAGTQASLEDLARIAAAARRSLWIDAATIDSAAACERFADRLGALPAMTEPAVIQLPSTAVAASRAEDWGACLRRLRAPGRSLAWAVPDGAIAECHGAPGSRACVEIAQEMAVAADGGLFTDVVFPRAALTVMRQLPAAAPLRWNVKGVPADAVAAVAAAGRFRTVLVDNDDPNAP